MERKIQIVFVLATLAVTALIIINFVMSPMESKREWLRTELLNIPEKGEFNGDLAPSISYSSLMDGRGDVWGSLVAAPEIKAEVKKALRPDMNKLMEGVQVTRFKIGDRIKIITKTNPDGGFYAVGDKVQGCVLSEFTRTDATFTLEWREGNEVLKLTLARQ